MVGLGLRPSDVGDGTNPVMTSLRLMDKLRVYAFLEQEGHIIKRPDAFHSELDHTKDTLIRYVVQTPYVEGDEVAKRQEAIHLTDQYIKVCREVAASHIKADKETEAPKETVRQADLNLQETSLEFM